MNSPSLIRNINGVSIKSELPDEFQHSHPTVKPEPEQDDEKVVDPLSTKRKPVSTVIDIKEGQKGISFAKLFFPYLEGSKEIKVIDPYLRFPYQIRNFFNFCECAAPLHGKMKIHLITGSDSNEEEVALSGEYQEIKKNLEQDRIILTYDFDRNQHDRSIETDTGWRITLGRGLDIFKKPEGRFTLGFVDQTKRECKATTITYVMNS